jgi:hypothetical protein
MSNNPASTVVFPIPIFRQPLNDAPVNKYMEDIRNRLNFHVSTIAYMEDTIRQRYARTSWYNQTLGRLQQQGLSGNELKLAIKKSWANVAKDEWMTLAGEARETAVHLEEFDSKAIDVAKRIEGMWVGM